MDFKLKKYGEGQMVVAVPSNEGGSFIMDHGPWNGVQVHKEIEVSTSQGVIDRVAAGDTSSVEARFTADPTRPGFYEAAEGAGRVSVKAYHNSENTVSYPVTSFQEVTPYVEHIETPAHLGVVAEI